ncbi:hypothetical protein CNBI1190 [Cryptococcus deneoformans B-3501A]|uniref:hypothetical protein n=1 Tax=Cryptococcus deneoformans (strain B-3501A) TaxID=283643 RepID=UPI000042DE73|nr:hypothetical protein CNBI1190 [Cryptococcus neoformans var. neoformans B-3501A]EAL18858.1 hypothetical protein CNBI1190 [Cryptococcus neoformans var. neoformans B-3501A]
MVGVSTSSFIGVGIACAGNILISLALTIQKLAHRNNEEALHVDQDPSASDSEPPSPPLRPRSRTRFGDPSPILEESEPPTPHHDRFIHDDDGSENGGSSRDDRMGEGRYGLGLEDVVAVPVTFISERSKSNPEATRITSYQSNDLSRSSSRGPPPVPIFPPKHTSLRVKLDPNPPAPRHSRHDDPEDESEDEGEDGDDETVGLKITDGRDIGKVEEGMYLKSKLWWLGMVLIAVGEGGNFLSYGFAPASVVAPLGTVALIANCIFAPLILGERFRTRDMVGMALAIIGAVTVVQASSDTSPRLDPDQLLMALTRLPFLLYTLFSLLILPPLLFLSNSSFGQAHLTIDVGICALFGGFTVLATKALSSLLSGDFVGAWKSGVTWACLAVVGGTSLGQIRWLNRALMRFQSKEVIPTQFVLFTLAAIIGSAVLFQEFRDITLSRFINFAFGIATIFLGVHLLTSITSPTLIEKDEEGNQAAAEQSYEHVPIPYTTSSTSLHRFFSNTSERTPLIRSITPTAVPVPTPFSTGRTAGIDGLPRRHSDAPLARAPHSAPLVGPSVYAPTAATHGRARLGKRTSASSFQSSIPKLGLGSQAGLLLIATTPPNTGYLASRGREWSVGPTGKTGGGGVGVGEEEASLETSLGDEDEGRRGRSKSSASLFPRSRTPSVARPGGRDKGR